MCVENVTDLFLWLNADGLGGSASSRLPPNDVWRRHSLSYVHNSLWRGDTAYTFDADINNSQVFETQSYTTLIRLGPLEALVAYNRYYHPVDGAPGCQNDKNGKETAEVCSTAFVMRITLARKAAEGPRQKTDDLGRHQPGQLLGVQFPQHLLPKRSHRSKPSIKPPYQERLGGGWRAIWESDDQSCR